MGVRRQRHVVGKPARASEQSGVLDAAHLAPASELGGYRSGTHGLTFMPQPPGTRASHIDLPAQAGECTDAVIITVALSDVERQCTRNKLTDFVCRLVT